MEKSSRFAIITPYHKEKRPILKRCIDSVAKQTMPADHFLVADGFPQPWLDSTNVRHIKLDRRHGDSGNAARGIGALLAVAERYEAIGLLDADNWLDQDHVAVCAAAGAVEPRADVVVAQRRLLRADDSVMDTREEPGFVDTNCYWFQPPSFAALHHWVTMPRELSLIGDRLFYQTLRTRKFVLRKTEKATVNWFCNWAAYYAKLGETPPEGAQGPIDLKPLAAWVNGLGEGRLRTEIQLAGSDFRVRRGDAVEGIDRNADCPCGSGKRYKHCHGALR